LSTWIFLRHGESTANAARVFSGHEDVALTDRGRAQAAAAGEQLSPTLVQYEQIRVLSSTLQRARVTADLALQAAGYDLPVISLDALRERRLGDWQGKSIDELKKIGARDTLLRWDGRPPGGGESLQDLAARLLPCLSGHDDGTAVLVVCHGGVVRTAAGLGDEMDLPALCRWNVRNCELVIRQYATGIWDRLWHDHFPGGAR